MQVETKTTIKCTSISTIAILFECEIIEMNSNNDVTFKECMNIIVKNNMSEEILQQVYFSEGIPSGIVYSKRHDMLEECLSLAYKIYN